MNNETAANQLENLKIARYIPNLINIGMANIIEIPVTNVIELNNETNSSNRRQNANHVTKQQNAVSVMITTAFFVLRGKLSSKYTRLNLIVEFMAFYVFLQHCISKS